MNSYAITGSSGFIGYEMKKRLGEPSLEIDIRKGSNILDINSLGHNIETQPIDIFYHFAAYSKIAECIKNPKLPHINNATGTHEVLEFCRQNEIKKIVYTSSSRVLSEEENPYTASKKYTEHLLEAYRQCYGIDYIIIRPSAVYSEQEDLTTRFITNWVKQAVEGKPLVIYGNKEKTLDFTYVGDFIDGVELLVESWETTKNKSYDISGEDSRTLVEVYEIIKDITKTKSPLVFEKPEIAQPQKVKLDISAMKKLGYQPKVKLEEGIKKIYYARQR